MPQRSAYYLCYFILCYIWLSSWGIYIYLFFIYSYLKAFERIHFFWSNVYEKDSNQIELNEAIDGTYVLKRKMIEISYALRMDIYVVSISKITQKNSIKCFLHRFSQKLLSWMIFLRIKICQLILFFGQEIVLVEHMGNFHQ